MSITRVQCAVRVTQSFGAQMNNSDREVITFTDTRQRVQKVFISTALKTQITEVIFAEENIFI